MSKQSQIESHLLEGKTLTQEQAQRKFNHWRLASVVLRMRKKGIVVLTNLVGDTKHALYYVSKTERTKWCK